MLTFDTYYHIYNHANGDENLFREKKNYHFFLKKYHQHIDPIAETIAWCLMPNHFHLLVKIKSEEEMKNSTFSKFETLEKLIRLEKLEDKNNFISKQFSNFFSSYTQSFNKIYFIVICLNLFKFIYYSEDFRIRILGAIVLNLDQSWNLELFP